MTCLSNYYMSQPSVLEFKRNHSLEVPKDTTVNNRWQTTGWKGNMKNHNIETKRYSISLLNVHKFISPCTDLKITSYLTVIAHFHNPKALNFSSTMRYMN